jgi:hypothetical protein
MCPCNSESGLLAPLADHSPYGVEPFSTTSGRVYRGRSSKPATPTANAL